MRLVANSKKETLLPLRARLQMTKLHHKLGFINFIITSEVIIKVPLAEPLLAEAVPPVLAEARLQPVQVVHQGLHHLILHQLSSGRLDCCGVPFPNKIKWFKDFIENNKVGSCFVPKSDKIPVLTCWYLTLFTISKSGLIEILRLYFLLNLPV